MKELQYPFDANCILTKKKSIRRELLKDTSGMLSKNIAILGGYTTNNIKLMMELFLLDQGIMPSFYESEYNQFYQDAMFDNAELEAFKPDIIYICTSNRNITEYPGLDLTPEQIDELLSGETEKYCAIWDSLTERYHCPIIQNNFELPGYRLMGNRDALDIHGKVNFINRLNLRLSECIGARENVFVCDINYLSADFGLSKWSDPFYWHMNKYAVSVDAIPYLAFNVSNIIKSVFGKNKKGLVLDLDNTLWGGVIGDDGAENIVIGPEEPEGQVYTEFQKYIKEQQDLGVILNIDSKNDEENALSGLAHPDSVLKKDDFIVIKANWEPKDKNFGEIASTLDLSPESLVFIDDNPAERNIVSEQIPGVVAPELGEVYQYINRIDRGGYFEVTSLTADDKKRNDMYRENAIRRQQQVSFADYGDYLRSLEMKAVIGSFEPVHMARIAQLTNKSNQFNLTTRRYTQTEIEEISSDDEYITLYGKLIDKFGDNGVVSVIIGHIIENVCHVDLWIMSCRVLKRDMEFAMMDALVSECAKRGISAIKGYYYPTAKNKMVKDFFGLQGFDKTCEDGEGNSEWLFNISPGYKNKNTVIAVEGGQGN